MLVCMRLHFPFPGLSSGLGLGRLAEGGLRVRVPMMVGYDIWTKGYTALKRIHCRFAPETWLAFSVNTESDATRGDDKYIALRVQLELGLPRNMILENLRNKRNGNETAIETKTRLHQQRSVRLSFFKCQNRAAIISSRNDQLEATRLALRMPCSLLAIFSKREGLEKMTLCWYRAGEDESQDI